MISDTEWIPPPFVVAMRHPEVRLEWAAKVTAWEKANAKLASDWEAALQENSQYDANRRRRAIQLANLRASEAPLRLEELWESGLNPTRAVEAVRTFLQSEKTFLLLLGSPGTGKTTATAEALVRGGVFWRAVTLSRFSSYDEDDRRAWDSALSAEILVLDDLGAELLHDGWRPMVDELIDKRWGNRLCTIITSNLDKDGFKTRYGVRIADRIRHDGFIETCGDSSFRKPGAP